jgi:FHA domain-containing protein
MPLPAPVALSPAAPFPEAPARQEHAPAAPRPEKPGPDAPKVAGWTAVVTADRAYFDSVVSSGLAGAAVLRFPDYWSERRFELTGQQMRIGRVSQSRGFSPELDLTGPPTDPGISRLHAVLIPEPDGTWAILDPGSENGTVVNGIEIATDRRIRLRDGDRVHLGAWTVLTIHAS